MKEEIRTVTYTYTRERYTYYLGIVYGIRQDRMSGVDRLKDPERVAEVLTRWLRRSVRDEAIVTGQARVTAHHEVFTDRIMLRAEAYAFEGVQPQHRDVLTRWIDRLYAHRVQLLEGVPREAV